MDKIQTTDCYVPVDFITPIAVCRKNFFTGRVVEEVACLEKKEGVIVLTPEEFEKEVSERVQSALSTILNVNPQSLPNI